MDAGIRVTVWNEGVHERESEEVARVYPERIGRQVANAFEGKPGIGAVRCVELCDDGQGLTDALLDDTDVLFWWGHTAHDRVTDENAERVQHRVLGGMGLVVLHSAHNAKPFRRLMGTTCALRWREWQGVGERERLWVVDPAHPIAEGLSDYLELPHTEMYGEHYDIPRPDQQVFISWFQGGEVFRSGCCWHRGQGKVFYFRPGHETFPIYYDEQVQHVLYNAARWAAPTRMANPVTRGNVPPLEHIG